MAPDPERDRLAALSSYDVLDAPADPALDGLVQAAALVAECPTALVGLMAADRQWFAARHGTDAVASPRDVTFCDQVVRDDEVVVVPDARLDPRFRTRPSVTGPPHVRFYAGFPLRTPHGHVLGTLCVTDDAARPDGLTDRQRSLLTTLADQVMTQLELRRALSAERTSRDQYALLAESASDIVSRHLPDGTVLYVSPSVRRVLGHDPAAELGTPAPDRVHPEDGPALGAALQTALGGRPAEVTVRSRHADGGWRWLEIALSPITAQGAVVELHSVSRDVTARVEASRALAASQAELSASEQRFRSLFDHSPVGQTELAPDGVVLAANTAFADLLGQPDAAALSGRGPADFTPESDRQHQAASIAQAAAEPGTVRRYARTLHRADGTTVEVDGTVVAVPGPDGTTARIIGTALDVTERNRARRDLEQLNAVLAQERATSTARAALLDTLLDTVDVGIVACDEEGRLTLFNAATRSFHGLPPDPDLPPDQWSGRYALYAEDGILPLPEAEVPLLRALRDGDVRDAVIVIAVDGRPPRTVRCDGRRLVDTAGQVRGAVVAMTDVTAVRAATRALAEREAFLRTLLDSAETAILACDASGGLTYLNPAAQELYGRAGAFKTADPADAATGAVLADSAGRELGRDERPLVRALREGTLRDVGMVVRRPGREPRHVLAQASAIRDGDGRLLGAVASSHDVTELRHSEQRFRYAFLNSPTAAARLDGGGQVLEANAALRRLLAQPTWALHGRPLAVHLHPDDATRGLAAVAEPTPPGQVTELRLLRADGSAVWCELAATRTTVPGGDEELLVQLVDVDARKAHELRLEQAAQRDPLTGLGNRTVLTAELGRLLHPATGAGAALVLLDLDDFKTVNDTRGHDAGDRVLVETAARLLATVHPDDTVVRLGGDEFCVVCPVQSGAPLAAFRLAERLEAALSRPVHHGGHLLTGGASVGVAVAAPGAQPSRLLEAADQAMYERKRQRRAGGRRAPGLLHPPARRRRRARSTPDGRDERIADLLADAVPRQRLRLEYQPVVDATTGTVVAVEALLRLSDGAGRAVPPDGFISAAEELGHIGEIGAWALRQALTDAARWKRSLPAGAPFLVGVNVSPLQLLDPAFPDLLGAVVVETGIDPAAVSLEVTEGRLLPDTAGVRAVLTRVRELGAHLAADDFGTGYACPAYLGSFPFDTLKLDRRWTSRLPYDARTGTRPLGDASRLAAGVVALAVRTGLVLVAEGVETPEEQEAVLDHGITLAQGYLWARPQPVGDIDRLVAACAATSTLARLVPAMRTAPVARPDDRAAASLV